MNRLGIYIIYDSENIIDKYISKVLFGLQAYISKLIVVCNFTDIKSGRNYIEEYADEIRYRENMGFDAGAYKDVLQEMFASKEIFKFDEVLLMNDSFYGPIDSFDKVFSVMSESSCDYWGLTRYPGGNYEKIEIASHIQSYFMCFRKAVVNSKEFRDFWLGIKYPATFIEAVFSFEFQLNHALEKAGFTGMAYMDGRSDSLGIQFGENPYMKYPLELLRDIDIPIIKRKAFDFENDGFCDAVAALSYIDRYKQYDAEIIKRHIFRVSQQLAGAPKFDLSALSNFYEHHSNIYIYGAGRWGKNLASYFAYKGWSFKKYIVTINDGYDKNVIQYDESILNESDGIIIAVGKRKIIEDIYNNISKRHSTDHIFKPEYV